MGSSEWLLATFGAALPYVLFLLPPLVLSGVVFRDATKRDVRNR